MSIVRHPADPAAKDAAGTSDPAAESIEITPGALSGRILLAPGDWWGWCGVGFDSKLG
jgi:hypothetical protein